MGNILNDYGQLLAREDIPANGWNMNHVEYKTLRFSIAKLGTGLENSSPIQLSYIHYSLVDNRV